MVWNKCVIHIILAISSYILLFFAALSGAVYFAINRAQSVSSSSLLSTEESLAYWGEIRFRLISYYLLFGFLIFTAALVVGVLKAKIYWGNYWSWDIKTIFSFIMWIYYLGVIVMNPILRIKKYEKRELMVSALSIAGIAFVILNLIFGNFSKVHHYL